MGKFLNIFKVSDLRKKVFIILGILGITRLLAAIPVPGIDTSRLQELFSSNQLFGFLNLFSGGGLSNFSLVMLGVGPYITASIIMQLLTIIFPALKKAYYEEGPAGRAKFNRISRYLTVPLAVVQAYSFINLLVSQGILRPLAPFELVTDIVIITAGSVLLMWLGELITEYKIGNGVSLIIFAGIVAKLPQFITQSIASYTPAMLPIYAAFIILAVVVIAGVVFISEGERKIPVTYAKQVRGNKLYGGASSYLPLKVNQAGVIPIIFAVSVVLFPQFIAQGVALFSPELSITLTGYVNSFFNNILLYSAVYFLLVVMFTYLYTSITFDPAEIAKNLQRAGGFIPGIRPGSATSDYIHSAVGRTTLFGALFLGVIAILPHLTQVFTGVKALALGGTGLLIVVSVALETMKQLESQLTMREYEGIF
jgi:preprotein translocase subunit SecY